MHACDCSGVSSRTLERDELVLTTGRVSLDVSVHQVVCDFDQFPDEVLRSSLQRAVSLAYMCAQGSSGASAACSALPSQIQASLSASSLLPLP